MNSIPTLLLIILYLPSLFILSQSTDTLTLGIYLTDGNSLVSSSNIFELGFFSLNNSNNRYIGIWYHNFSPKTVIWVANRETPLTDNSGSLKISPQGNLILLNSTNNILWSSNTSSASPNETTLTLLDSGNLQLNDSRTCIWQSFDNPTNMYLPGMKIGLDLATNKNQLLTSWKNTEDPRAGNFSIGMDPDRSTQIFIWEGSKPRWRTGRWNGQVFIGIEYMVPFYIDGFQVSNYEREGKMYFFYPPGDVYHRFLLTWDGILEHRVWDNDTKAWSNTWAQPNKECEFYNKCGNGAICEDGNNPICTCLQGFVPKSMKEWSNGDWSNGCIKRTPLKCERNNSNNGSLEEEDGFFKLESLKVPDSSDLYQDVNDISGCEKRCRENCSCKAYSYVTGIGCLVWGVDLVDIHVLSSAGNDFYLRLAGSELNNKKKKKNTVAIVVGITVSATVVSVLCIYLVMKYRKRVKDFIELQNSQSRGPNDHFSSVFAIRDDDQDGKSKDSPLLSFDSIVAATENFSLHNLLGKGGFGPVYMGTLPDGQEIAVKRLSRSSGQGLEEFKNEVILISKLQHRNLVRLLGCCVQGEEKILIYEYMPNRSLDAFLFDTNKNRLLDWKTRYEIIQGFVRGLLYLHRDSRLRVIHRDLKVSNILLDEEMNPKISDFGMARIFGRDDNETNTKRVVGTYGYMSPEYAMQGAFSVKSDVYSFGVLLLEIVSGEKNSAYENPELCLGLLPYAWKLWNEDNVKDFIDPSIRDSCTMSEVSRCINVGLLCVQDQASERPTMSLVVTMLDGGSSELGLPRQPTFAAKKTPRETDTSTSDLKHSGHVSFTTLTGR